MLSRTALRLSAVSTRPVRGVDFLRNRFTNKGTAFTLDERKYLGIDGLLPPSVERLSDQVNRSWEQLQLFHEPINKYTLLRSLQDTNITLYYALLSEHMQECLPIIYTPTVGEACQRYSDLFQKDHGLYISLKDRGNIAKLIHNLRKPNIDIIVITDGSRILGLGDLGINGMGISIGKTSLYVAAGGIRPSRVLPVVLDVGTNNEMLRNDSLYLGARKKRCDDATFYSVLDEFMEAASTAWPQSVIQFEDFSSNHCFDMLERYREQYRCFNDDIQGTGATVSAGFVAAMRMSNIEPSKHRVLFFGAGSAATGVADSIVSVLSEMLKLSEAEVRSYIYFVDSKGLVATNRGDKLASHKVPYARSDIPDADLATLTTLDQVVKYVKPTALMGLAATGGAFTREIVEDMCQVSERPIIFPLSNPSSKSEITPAHAYEWSHGKAIVASGSPFPPYNYKGEVLIPSQGNNLYVFPGVGLGCSIAQPKHIPQQVLITAADTLSRAASPKERAAGQLYPPISSVRNVSRDVAVAVALKLQEMGLAGADLPDNIPEMRKLVEDRMWQPKYSPSQYYYDHQLMD